MVDMQNFALWFLSEIPEFFLRPPISAFVGLCLLFVVIKLFGSIIKIN